MRRTFVRFLAIGLMSAALVATGAAAAEPQTKPMKPALLVIDIQNAYLPMMSAEGKDLDQARRSQGRQELSQLL